MPAMHFSEMYVLILIVLDRVALFWKDFLISVMSFDM